MDKHKRGRMCHAFDLGSCSRFLAKNGGRTFAAEKIQQILEIGDKEIGHFGLGYARGGTGTHLRSEGFDQQDIDRHCLNVPMNDRITFPLRTVHGKTVGVIGLGVGSDVSAKYMILRSYEEDRSELFFGDLSDCHVLVLCEDPRRVIDMHKAGCNAVVMPIRPLIGQSQRVPLAFDVLQRQYRKAILMCGGDGYGRRLSEETAKHLEAVGIGTEVYLHGEEYGK